MIDSFSLWPVSGKFSLILFVFFPKNFSSLLFLSLFIQNFWPKIAGIFILICYQNLSSIFQCANLHWFCFSPSLFSSFALFSILKRIVLMRQNAFIVDAVVHKYINKWFFASCWLRIGMIWAHCDMCVCNSWIWSSTLLSLLFGIGIFVCVCPFGFCSLLLLNSCSTFIINVLGFVAVAAVVSLLFSQ